MTLGSQAKRILFVCTANQHRSRTAEDLYRSNPRFEVRSAGTDASEVYPDERPLTEEDTAWADVIFVMERYHARFIEEHFPGAARKVVVLNIPDIYYRGDPRLVQLLRDRLAPYIGSP
jgi:protein-tyrosine phosphatase